MTNNNPPRKRRTIFLSLRVKLLVSFTLLFSVVFAGAYYWFYQFSTDTAMQRIRGDMVDALKGAVAGMNGANTDELIALFKEGTVNKDHTSDDPRFAHQIALLEQFHSIAPRAWLYTYVKDPDSTDSRDVVYLVDLWQDYNPDHAAGFKEKFTSKGKLPKGLTDLYLNADQPYTDKWGKWISAYAPLKDSKGNLVAAMGLDFAADYVYEVQGNIINSVAFAFGATYILLFVFVFVISRIFTRRIRVLDRIAMRIADGKYDNDLSWWARDRFPDEIAHLAEVFEQMSIKVAGREQELKQEVEDLKIQIDQTKRDKQVSEVVESEFFQELTLKAKKMRERAAAPPETNLTGDATPESADKPSAQS